MSDVRLSPAARQVFVATGVGNALEWFDWGIYASFSAYLSHRLFDPADPTSALLATLAVFAVGFLARPVGGLVLGRLCDVRGRRYGLLLTVGLASAGSLLVAACPTYDAVGLWASVVLLVARLMQGLAHGGELPAAQTYLAEHAPPARRGLWSSWIYFSGTLGMLAGLLLGAVLATVLPAGAMDDWGWRIPFALGGLLGFGALRLRRDMPETLVFEAGLGPAERENLVDVLRRQWRQGLKVVGLTSGATVTYYVWAASAPAYATTVLGIDPAGALWAGVVGNLVLLLVLPLWGALSDRVGRKPVLLVAMAATAVLFVPASLFVRDSAVHLTISMSVMLAVLAAYAAVAPAVYAEMFPTSVRAVGFGLPYSVAIAAFGGTAPLLQTWTTQHLGPRVFPAYAVGLVLVSGAVLLTLPESRGIDLDA